MAGPVYKLFVLKFKQPWYQLSQEEQQALFAKGDAAFKEVGGKSIITCDASWSSEQWPGFGVEEFPDIEALQTYSRRLQELNWFRYFESETMLGTKWEPS